MQVEITDSRPNLFGYATKELSQDAVITSFVAPYVASVGNRAHDRRTKCLCVGKAVYVSIVVEMGLIAGGHHYC